jgi:hypothetical protein
MEKEMKRGREKREKKEIREIKTHTHLSLLVRINPHLSQLLHPLQTPDDQVEINNNDKK